MCRVDNNKNALFKHEGRRHVCRVDNNTRLAPSAVVFRRVAFNAQLCLATRDAKPGPDVRLEASPHELAIHCYAHMGSPQPLCSKGQVRVCYSSSVVKPWEHHPTSVAVCRCTNRGPPVAHTILLCARKAVICVACVILRSLDWHMVAIPNANGAMDS